MFRHMPPMYASPALDRATRCYERFFLLRFFFAEVAGEGAGGPRRGLGRRLGIRLGLGGLGRRAALAPAQEHAQQAAARPLGTAAAIPPALPRRAAARPALLAHLLAGGPWLLLAGLPRLGPPVRPAPVNR